MNNAARHVVVLALWGMGLFLAGPTFVGFVVVGRWPSGTDEWVMLYTGVFLLLLTLALPEPKDGEGP